MSSIRRRVRQPVNGTEAIGAQARRDLGNKLTDRDHETTAGRFQPRTRLPAVAIGTRCTAAVAESLTKLIWAACIPFS
jgi:hypothetical protein